MHERSFDLFGDEVIYTDLGRSVASGGFPRFDGQLFFLHPPAFFYLEAGWQRLLGSQPGLVAQIYQMRTLNALIAGVTGTLMVLLSARATNSLLTGSVVGMLFALDPFCIRQNDRVLLETSMMLWVLLGYVLYLSMIGRPRSRWLWTRAVGAGLLFSIAVLTKDEATLLTVFPLLLAAMLRWGARRAVTLLTAGTTVSAYAAYVAVVAANGHIGAWLQQKTMGIQRILGLVQVTGFHQKGSPSILSVLLSESNYFGTTYVILILAVPALFVVHQRGDHMQRMLGLFWIVAGVTLGYALVFGTLEEQELYLLIIPSLLLVPVAATLLFRPRQVRRGPAREGRAASRWQPVAIVGLALAMSLNAATWAQWRLRPDDGYAQLLRYMALHIPAGTTITAVDGTTSDGITQYALANRYNVGRWVTPTARCREQVRYVVIPWLEIREHYSYYSPAQVRDLVRHGQLLFSFRGPTYADVTLYRVPLPFAPGHRQSCRT
jgi:Dolichyl-phosphate-mannose-protein mannosyltransferase